MTEPSPTTSPSGRRLLTALAALVVVLAAACSPSGDAEQAPAAGEEAPAAGEGSAVDETAPAATEYVYVASQSGPAASVVSIDPFEVVAVLDLAEHGFTANAKPHDTAVEPDGSHWYVSLIADHRVLKLSRSHEIVAAAEFETPGLLALDPGNDFLYVGRSMAAVNPPPRIGVIHRPDMEITETEVFLPRPHALAVAPGGGSLFIASLAVNQMAWVDPFEEEIELLNVEGDTHTFVQYAVSPDGRLLVTGGQVSGEVLVFDIEDPAAPELLRSLAVGGQPWHPTFSADGSRVWFPQNTANAVAVVDTTSWEQVGSIEHEALVEPHGSALSPDGHWLLVSARNTTGEYPGGEWKDGSPMGTVVKIDATSGEVVGVVEVPPYAAGMATRPPHQ